MKPPARSNREIPSAQRARSVFVALLPVFACLLGGATTKWAEGIIIGCLGFYLLFAPPRHSLGWVLNAVLAAFLLCALLSFLSASLFATPVWRKTLTEDLHLALPSTLTSQPWLTAGCFISLFAAVCWLYLVSTQELELRAVRIQLRLFATGIVALALLTLLLRATSYALPFWPDEHGPFPDRNQTADLFAVASILVLAAGQDDFRYGRKRWILWTIALAILVTAIALNSSEDGVLIVIGGCAIWIAAVALRSGSRAGLALAASLVLLLAAAVFIFAGQSLGPFHLPAFAGTAAPWTNLGSVNLRDAWRLIQSAPWPGLGLGNFETVVPLERAISRASSVRYRSPGDLLWLWGEMGPVAPVLVTGGLIILLSRMVPLTVGTNQRFRLGAVMGVAVFALHGLSDASCHVVATAYCGLLLLGLALHRPLTLRTSQTVAWIFRGAGLLLLVAGISWTMGTRAHALLPGSIGVASARQLATEANRGHNFPEAVRLATRAMEWAPLDGGLYLVRGTGEVLGGGSVEDARADLRRARFLQPDSPEVALEEGFVWLKVRPDLAEAAWDEALRRAGTKRVEVFSQIMSRTGSRDAAAQPLIKRLAFSEHDLALAYFAHLNANEFRPAFAKFFEGNPDFESIPPAQKRELFRLWDSRGDNGTLLTIASEHPEWLPYTWRTIANSRAAAGDFRGACELMEQFDNSVRLPAADASRPASELRREAYRGSTNFLAGYSLYQQQMQAGQTDDALATVRHFTENGNIPVYFHYLEAKCWAKKGAWDRAWTAWKAFEAAKAR